MTFVRIVKNSAYFKKFQVQFRRRRECKTDYQQRRGLITQDKNKYDTPKYRLVVRVTNTDVIAQIFSADLEHDQCICAAYAHELSRYGIKVGFSNYAACYATGLLLARRIDRKFRLYYEGNTEIDGSEYHVADDEQGMAPFRAVLDVGLARTTAGARVFGVMKGACDGGLDIPHNKKNRVPRMYPGSFKDEDSKKWQYEADTHRKYIFGGHVAEYMRFLQENDVQKYQKQFSQFIANGLGPDDLEPMYARAHALIRRDPYKPRDPMSKGCFGKREKPRDPAFEYKKVRHNPARRAISQRKDRVKMKLTAKGKQSLELLEKHEKKN